MARGALAYDGACILTSAAIATLGLAYAAQGHSDGALYAGAGVASVAMRSSRALRGEPGVASHDALWWTDVACAVASLTVAAWLHPLQRAWIAAAFVVMGAAHLTSAPVNWGLQTTGHVVVVAGMLHVVRAGAGG